VADSCECSNGKKKKKKERKKERKKEKKRKEEKGQLSYYWLLNDFAP
jgi:hypothetical protein